MDTPGALGILERNRQFSALPCCLLSLYQVNVLLQDHLPRRRGPGRRPMVCGSRWTSGMVKKSTARASLQLAPMPFRHAVHSSQRDNGRSDRHLFSTESPQHPPDKPDTPDASSTATPRKTHLTNLTPCLGGRAQNGHGSACASFVPKKSPPGHGSYGICGMNRVKLPRLEPTRGWNKTVEGSLVTSVGCHLYRIHRVRR